MIVETDIPAHLLELSVDYAKPEKKKRQNNDLPDTDALTVKQREVYDTIIAFLSGRMPDTKMISFMGYAGTGKTFIVTQVLKWYIRILQEKIAITAPTNKAVKVLRTSASFEHYLITYATIHSLFGLREDTDERTGKLYFKRAFGIESEVANIDTLVVDETSMLADDLFEYIEHEVNRDSKKKDDISQAFKHYGVSQAVKGLKVLFVGDPLQIPPVNKADCIPFNPEMIEQKEIHTLFLDEIIRQKEGNPIIELATLVRDNYQSAVLPYERKTKVTDQGAVVMISAKDKANIMKVCEIYFTNVRYKDNSDFMRVIAYTNKTVEYMNGLIRLLIYKDELAQLKKEAEEDEFASKDVRLPKIMIGEKLIADSPIFEYGSTFPKVIFTTNDEFEIVDYKIGNDSVFQGTYVKVYHCTVKHEDAMSGKWIKNKVTILHEDSEVSFNRILAQLTKNAQIAPEFQRKQEWKKMYAVKNRFAAIKHAYAITAHKSQGSTYENAMVIVADIDVNKNTVERNRIKYVAFTRASKNLFIVE